MNYCQVYLEHMIVILRKIEDEYNVSVVNRGDDVVISGEEAGVLKSKDSC